MATTTTAPAWRTLKPDIPAEFTDSRLQLHYAAQFAAALGISYLAPRSDDIHTNLGWDAKHEALKSREVRALSHSVQVAVRPRDLTLLVLLDGAIGQRIPLNGVTIGQAESVLRTALSSAGLDGRRCTLRRHYELPPHPVAGGTPFEAGHPDTFGELANWYANAASVLEELKARIDGAEVRCWPHHFDIATLATFGPGRSSSAGMLPGDAMYPEPYYYVNAYPNPGQVPAGLALEGGGAWNTEGWFGAVLTASQLVRDQAGQAEQVRTFLNSAVDACATVLRNPVAPA